MARLEIITGPMFSGKSEELIQRLHVALYAEKLILVLKPKRDTRSGEEVSSRKKKEKDDPGFKKFSSLPAYPIETVEEAKELLELHKPDILAIDEGQFFDMSFAGFFKKLLGFKKYQKLTIIISGLDLTSEGEPFGPMPQFMALAHEITKMKAVCFKCRQWPPNAEMSYYKDNDKDGAIVVGDADKYEARCRECWEKPDQDS